MALSKQWNDAPWQAVLCHDISGEAMWVPVRNAKRCGEGFPATSSSLEGLRAAIDMSNQFDAHAFFLAQQYPATVFAITPFTPT